MIRSMTGYGEAEQASDGGRIRAEIKTVNHRFLNTAIRLPHGLDRHEHRVEGWLRERMHRGHVSVSVTFERADDPSDDLPQLDVARAKHAYELYRKLGEELGVIGKVDVATIGRFPDVIRAPDPRRDLPEIPVEELESVIMAAAGRAVELRETEGERLRADLEGRLDAITTRLDAVEARAPERLTAERDRLRQKISELLDDVSVDDERLAREVAWMAEKWDINEEVVRFRSHVELMRETLDSDGSDPVGKRLTFIVQEMHREANTIGSKANDSGIAAAAVAMKEEVERLREQVENVE